MKRSKKLLMSLLLSVMVFALVLPMAFVATGCGRGNGGGDDNVVTNPSQLEGQWAVSQQSRDMFANIFEWQASMVVEDDIRWMKESVASIAGSNYYVVEDLTIVQRWFREEAERRPFARLLQVTVETWTGSVEELWEEIINELAQFFSQDRRMLQRAEEEAEWALYNILNGIDWLSFGAPLTVQIVQDYLSQAVSWTWIMDEHALIEIGDEWTGDLNGLLEALEAELVLQNLILEATWYAEGIAENIISRFGLDMEVANDLENIQEWFYKAYNWLSEWEWVPYGIFELVAEWTGTAEALWDAIYDMLLENELAFAGAMIDMILDMLVFEIEGNEIVIAIDLDLFGIPADFELPSFDNLIAMAAYELFGIEEPITLDEFLTLFLDFLYEEAGIELEITVEDLEFLVDLFEMIETALENGYLELRFAFSLDNNGRLTFDNMPSFDDALTLLSIVLPLVFGSVEVEAESGQRPVYPDDRNGYHNDGGYVDSESSPVLVWMTVAVVAPLAILHGEIIIVTATQDTIAIAIVLDAEVLYDIYNTIYDLVYEVLGFSLEEIFELEEPLTQELIAGLIAELYQLAQGTPMAEMLTHTAGTLTANVLSFTRVPNAA